jgi:hypothetical protein
LGVSSIILGIVTELTFINEVDSPKYFEVVGEGMAKFIPPSDEKFKWAKELLKSK